MYFWAWGLIKLSLRNNVLASYVAQLYTSLTGIIVFPLYMKYMGAEAYGLIGFFMMLQTFFTLLDIGLTPTIARETARYHGGAISALYYRQLFRALSLIFFAIAILGSAGFGFFSKIIASKWLNTSELPLVDVLLCIKIMGVSVAFRWAGGLYRGVISGAESLVWLSSFNVIFSSLRFFGVFFIMYQFGFVPVVFFVYQFFIALVEIFVLWYKGRSLVRDINDFATPIGWSFKPVKEVLGFSLIVAVTSSIGVLLTQTDKLVLSGVLSLAEYGHFALAIMVASGIMIISNPISSALMPRMVRLHSEGKSYEFFKIYRDFTRLVSILAGSLSIAIAFCSKQLLYAWIGDQALAADVAPILSLYAIGNGFFVISAFAYYLQYAKGDLRYHFIGNVVMLFFLVPIIIWTARHYGSIGAGYTWLLMNALFLFFWVGCIHSKIAPGIHLSWLFKSVLIVYVPALTLAFFISWLNFDVEGRLQNAMYFLVNVFLILVFSLCCARKERIWVGGKVRWLVRLILKKMK